MSKKIRSKRYNQTLKTADWLGEYEISEAVSLAKKSSYSNFDGSIELHVNLRLDPENSEHRVKVTTTLPFATGKTKTILAIAEGEKAVEAKKAGADHVGGPELIDKIADGWMDFDVIITAPDMMQKLVKVAKILGPKGLMPNPKTGTVTEDLSEAIEKQRQGQITLRTESEPTIHLAVGKVSQDAAEIEGNISHILKTLKAAKPAKVKGELIKSAYLSPTMGPSFRLKIS